MSTYLTYNPWNRWRRPLILWGAAAAGLLLLVALTWNSFFCYVPAGRHLIVIAKDGAPLPEGEVLALPGQKGVQKDVLGEGWHFVLPVVYTTELEDNTTIPAGKVGIVTVRGGKRLPPGQLLADHDDEQGIRRQVLPPGTYRLNLHGMAVEMVDVVEIRPGYAGVIRRLLGRDGTGRFASRDDEKGILKQVLQPGLYYLNLKEYEVLKVEVGIVQTTFHYDADAAKSTAITFTSQGGFPISMDCTVEWEVIPEHVPALIADFGTGKAVERTVIDLQAHTIGRDKGIDYGVQDFLEGVKREKFQDDFTRELVKVCGEKNVTVHSAFIRDIVIPEEYLTPIREKQIAAEKQLTNQALEATRMTEAEVEREQRMVEQKGAEVAADTKRLVATIDRSVENTQSKTQAEIEQLKASYGAKIASLDAERVQVLGVADTTATRLKETAKSRLYAMKLQVFQNDGNAFLRYSLAEQLNPKMHLRLFQSGPGTFWTNMQDKGMNFMMPLPAAEGAKTADSPAK